MNSLVSLVGSSIKEVRKSKKMTQEVLAEKCGLQTSYLAGVERGDRNITLQTLERILDGLDETPFTIFNFEKLNTDNKNLEKKELIGILTDMFYHRSEEEIRLFLKIASDIFDTYKSL